jgi:phenylpropionate dioxygenase-like ring-hydroxylating dioxygenase large terminal subunit
MKRIAFYLLTVGSSHAFLSAKVPSSLSRLTSVVDKTPFRNPNVDELSAPSVSDKFDWFKAWYPLAPVNILDLETPHKFQLLGMDIVVWNDSPMEDGTFGPKPKKKRRRRQEEKGQWRAFVDECPHRKVPLSEGRVEADGSLMCSYHGWRFDGQGDVINVPQIGTSSDLQRVKDNPKSHCNSFPTRIVDGVLWIWPATGSDAKIESALTAPKLYEFPEDTKAENVWYGPWNYRELPYGYDYFIENVVDPAHVPGTFLTATNKLIGD